MVRTAHPNFSNLRIGHTQLRLAEPSDAAYIYSLRVDTGLNTYLSSAPPSVQAQQEWIVAYKAREANQLEHYFIICARNGQPCGTVRLYDYSDNSFCWGSWILDSQKSRFSAIESALLVYEAGFKRLGFPGSHFDVRKNNLKVISFHEKMGARIVNEDELNLYFEISPTDVAERTDALLHIIGETKK